MIWDWKSVVARSLDDLDRPAWRTSGWMSFQSPMKREGLLQAAWTMTSTAGFRMVCSLPHPPGGLGEAALPFAKNASDPLAVFLESLAYFGNIRDPGFRKDGIETTSILIELLEKEPKIIAILRIHPHHLC